MDLLPTAEQQQIVDMANSFLQREFPLADALNTGDQSDRVRREHLTPVSYTHLTLPTKIV